MNNNRNSKIGGWSSGDGRTTSATDDGIWSNVNAFDGAWGDTSQPENNYSDGWSNAENSYVPSTSTTQYEDDYNDDTTNNNWNTAVKGKSKRNRRFQTESKNAQRHFYNGEMPSLDDASDFPSLDKKPSAPVNNVWVKRQEKFETLKAMEPRSVRDEQEMIRQALEMSKKEVQMSVKRQKELEEEYKLQMLVLEMNPEQFSDFCTDEELATKISMSENTNNPEKEDPLTFSSFASTLKKKEMLAKQQSLTECINENSSNMWPTLPPGDKTEDNQPLSEYIEKNISSWKSKTLSSSEAESEMPKTKTIENRSNISEAKLKKKVRCSAKESSRS